jgi:hypothetical protein
VTAPTDLPACSAVAGRSVFLYDVLRDRSQDDSQTIREIAAHIARVAAIVRRFPAFTLLSPRY